MPLSKHCLKLLHPIEKTLKPANIARNHFSLFVKCVLVDDIMYREPIKAEKVPATEESLKI